MILDGLLLVISAALASVFQRRVGNTAMREAAFSLRCLAELPNREFNKDWDRAAQYLHPDNERARLVEQLTQVGLTDLTIPAPCAEFGSVHRGFK